VDVLETESLAFLVVVTAPLDRVIARMATIAVSATAMTAAVPMSALYSPNPNRPDEFGMSWYLLLFFSEGTI
jgi:hypothetical protein